MGRLRSSWLGFLLICQAGWFYAQTPSRPGVEVSIVDRSGQPVAGVRLELAGGDQNSASAVTDAAGRAVFPPVTPGRYTISASKEGFETQRQADVDLSSNGSGTIELTLQPPLAVHEHIDVQDTIDPVQQGSSTPGQLQTADVKRMPSKPATLSDALPMIPGVVRSPTGDLQISGTGEHRSALIVNSADVTDPATGQFGLTVPIDSVESLSVYQTPFLAEYGRFSAGLVSVETRRGGERWKWEINDPFPDFRIRSRHLRGIRDATPRLNAEGPVIPHRLYFSEGLEYEARNIEVHTLPFPFNQQRKAGINSFAQLDWVVSDKHLVTGTAHIAPQRLGFVNLDYFNPQPVTPDASTHNYTGTLADRLTVAGGLLENTFSLTRFDARVWPQGHDDMIISPYGNRGNYFASQDREASRLGWSPTYSLPPLNHWGTHAFKLGSYLAKSADQGQVDENPLAIQDAALRVLERIGFVGGRPFDMSDTEYAFFGQDHWSISSRVAADLGARVESQEVSHSVRVAPRAGIAWLPFSASSTVVRAGFGFFYDRVPLNVYSFFRYPRQVVSLYDQEGNLTGGPFYYENTLGEVITHPPFVFQGNVAGNFAPRSAMGSIQVEQSVTRLLKLRFGYLRSISAGLVTVNTVSPDPVTKIGGYELSGAGDSRYRQFEITARVRAGEKRQLFFSYVRNRAHGDLNDFAAYLGSFPVPVIRANQYGRLPGDLPNRFLAWGTLQLPHGFGLAPIMEYRDGFPYIITDAGQNYVGLPNHNRYPTFLSLDSRLSKDIKVNPKYSVRLSLVYYNLTNHFNPDTIHANIADPAYGILFGSRGRRSSVDFDVLF